MPTRMAPQTTDERLRLGLIVEVPALDQCDLRRMMPLTASECRKVVKPSRAS